MGPRDEDDGDLFPESVFPTSVFPRSVFPWMGGDDEEGKNSIEREPEHNDSDDTGET